MKIHGTAKAVPYFLKIFSNFTVSFCENLRLIYEKIKTRLKEDLK